MQIIINIHNKIYMCKLIQMRLSHSFNFKYRDEDPIEFLGGKKYIWFNQIELY